MTEVLIRDKSFVEDLKGLLLDNEQISRVILAVYTAIRASYKRDDEKQGIQGERSKAETARRFAICRRWVMVFIGDLYWPTRKVEDLLPQALRTELAGLEYVPPSVTTWAAFQNGE